MRSAIAFLAACIVFSSTVAHAAEYRVETSDESPPEELAAPVAQQLGPQSVRVVSGKSRTLCQLWLCKQWPAKADFKPSSTVLYPFDVGELIGVVKFRRKATDFRGQEIAAGVYTMRYGLQPVDGNHVGTSDTRDFLLLEKVDEDKQPQEVPQEQLFKRSAEAAGTSHPAIFSLLPAGKTAQPPSIEHDQQRDLWVVSWAGRTADGKSLPLALVVAGQSAG